MGCFLEEKVSLKIELKEYIGLTPETLNQSKAFEWRIS